MEKEKKIFSDVSLLGGVVVEILVKTYPTFHFLPSDNPDLPTNWKGEFGLVCTKLILKGLTHWKSNFVQDRVCSYPTEIEDLHNHHHVQPENQ